MPCVTLADLGAAFSEHFISTVFSTTLSFHCEPEKSYSVLLGLSAGKSTFPHEAGVLPEKTVGIGEKAETPNTLRILQDFPYVMLSSSHTTRHQKHQTHQSKMKSS